jgi:hypothetical protein
MNPHSTTNTDEKFYVEEATKCADAALRGDLESIKSLREKGEPWDWRTCASAAKRWDFELLEWLIQNGCPCDWWSSQCLKAAKEKDNIRLAILEQNDPLSAAIRNSEITVPWDVLK